MATTPDKFEVYQRILEKAWSDPEFKARLIEDPAAALREFDIHIKKGQRVRILEDDGDPPTLFLPNDPEGFIC